MRRSREFEHGGRGKRSLGCTEAGLPLFCFIVVFSVFFCFNIFSFFWFAPVRTELLVAALPPHFGSGAHVLKAVAGAFHVRYVHPSPPKPIDTFKEQQVWVGATKTVRCNTSKLNYIEPTCNFQGIRGVADLGLRRPTRTCSLP